MNQAQSEGQRSRATILWTRCALLGIVVFFIGVGWLGSDFGRHWDEHWMVAAWVETIEEEAYRSPRPYPGFYYDLTLPSLAWLSVQSPNREALLSQVQSPDFLISVRHQFVVFS
ncbi:MAG: hypothetical protein P8M78_11850, partial [Myxococcota bacterium]|nr:hypothetical protein [Myxococcota bacterium]